MKALKRHLASNKEGHQSILLSARYAITYISFFLCTVAFAQKQLVQVKAFDQQLSPYRNIDLSINGKEYFSTGSKGVAFIELADSDFPLKSIAIKSDKLEAASWNYSKGIIEVIIRTRSYQMISVLLNSGENVPLSRVKITFKGKTTTTAETDQDGAIRVPLALDETITSAAQFSVPGFNITGIRQSEGKVLLTAEAVIAAAAIEQPKTSRDQTPSYFRDFDLSKLDSIQSLTAFYAIFKNISMKEMSEQTKRRIDAKFHELVTQLQDSVTRNGGTIMGRISDSSFVEDDIRSLLSQAADESQMLDLQRQEFDEKIAIIRNKLADGISTMDEQTRANLLSDLMRLEAILRQNEDRFFKNQSDYREVINSLKEKYFDITDLENKLSESESKRLEERRAFRQKLFITLGILFVFAVLILLLVYFADKLKKQKKELQRVNGEINRINENLESLVAERTKLLAEANRELDTFLYRASHDLRSPVCSIIGLCNIALHMSNGESKELVERVVVTTSGMDRLLKKLSLISEINQPTNFSSITLLDVVENVRDQFVKTIEENKIKFNIDCPADLVFYSYPNLVEIIISNLVENAFFYSVMRNPNDAKVNLTAGIKGDQIEISVYDNGIGVGEDIAHRLFDMFFKGTEHSKGSGLGLYVVQKSVQALEGKIELESTVGDFTRFIVHLPLKPITFAAQKVSPLQIPVDTTFEQ